MAEIKVTNANPPKMWLEISHDGKIKYLDWTEAERLADRHAYLTDGLAVETKLNVVQVGMLATIVVAVRELVLKTVQETHVQGKPVDNKHGPKVPPGV